MFYDILKRKNAFLSYKKKKFKKSKNWHFCKVVNPWFWSKNGHFSNFLFFFRQYSAEKCVLRYSRTKKRLSRLYKKKNFKNSKNWNFCFHTLERRFFVLEYHNRHFPGLWCLKKKVGKMAIFGPKPWVNPFGKMSIFRHFELVVFIA